MSYMTSIYVASKKSRLKYIYVCSKIIDACIEDWCFGSASIMMRIRILQLDPDPGKGKGGGEGNRKT